MALHPDMLHSGDFHVNQSFWGEWSRFSLTISIFVHGLIEETQQTLVPTVGRGDAKATSLADTVLTNTPQKVTS